MALDTQLAVEVEILDDITKNDKTPETPEEFLAVVGHQRERVEACKTLIARIGG